MFRSLLRPIAMIAALAGLAAYAIITLRGPQGLRALEERQREIRVLEEENANIRREIETKKLRLERLKNDPGTQEIEVEKRLGKVHPGVTEFRQLGEHVGPDGNKPPAPASAASKPAQP